MNAIKTPFESVSWRSIRANLRMPTLGMGLFLIGFLAVYSLPLLFPATERDAVAAAVLPLYYLASGLILCGAFVETWNSGMWLLRRRPVWSAILLLSISLMTIQGLANGESIFVLMRQSFVFLLLLFVPAVGLHARNWPWLWMLFFVQGIIGLLYVPYAIFVGGATSRMSTMDMEGQSFLAVALYMAPFLFLMLPATRDRRLGTIILCLFGVELLRNLFFANRLTFFLLPVQVLMIAYIGFRASRTHKMIEHLFLGIIAVLLLVPVALAILYSSPMQRLAPAFEEGRDGLMGRMMEKGSVTATIKENERWREARDSMATMRGMDWIIGKGFGAIWSSLDFDEGSDRNMIHNTWLNSFFWGGIILFVVVAAPLVWAFRVFFRSRSTAGICCASFMLFIYAKFPAYLITTPTLQWILFCLVCGACAYHEAALPGRNSRTIHKPLGS